MRGLGGAIVEIGDLGIIPRILFATDGTIIHIVEAYAGEAVDLVRLRSSMVTDPGVRQELGAEPDERALQRLSLLRGRRSGRVFVHADSIVLLDRLPPPLADELMSTGTSILKLFAQHQIASFREGIGEWEGHDTAVGAHFDGGPDVELVARTYQIVVHGRPVAWITESFPKSSFS